MNGLEKHKIRKNCKHKHYIDYQYDVRTGDMTN